MPTRWPFALGEPIPFETQAELLASSEWPDGQTAVAEDASGLLYMWSSFFNELLGDGWLELATTDRATKWEISVGAPSDADGNENDLDLAQATGAIYRKVGGVWSPQFVGGAGVYDPYIFDATSTFGDPGSGKFRLVTAGNQNAATEINIKTINSLGNAYNLGQGKKTDTLFRIQKTADPTAYLTFRYVGAISTVLYQRWSVDIVDSSANNPFADGDAVVISWQRVGGLFTASTLHGAAPTGSGIGGDWVFDAETFALYKYKLGAYVFQAQPPIPPLFGDGSDSDAAFDGVNAVTGASRSGTTYTLTRDVFYTSMTVTAGVTVITAGWRIFVTGTLTNAGTIHNDGGAASGTTAGAAAAGGVYGGGTNGGAGVSSGTSTVGGTGGTSVSATGWHSLGGAGGTGGNANGGGGGPLRTKTPLFGYHEAIAILAGLAIAPSTVDASANNTPVVNWLAGGSGGGGGGRTTGGTAAATGAGGGGAGIVVISARIIDNNSGIIRANGGNGSNATGGTTSAGGGAGGGGGAVALLYSVLVTGTETANGGTKGTGLNGAAAAADGTAGRVVKVPA